MNINLDRSLFMRSFHPATYRHTSPTAEYNICSYFQALPSREAYMLNTYGSVPYLVHLRNPRPRATRCNVMRRVCVCVRGEISTGDAYVKVTVSGCNQAYC